MTTDYSKLLSELKSSYNIEILDDITTRTIYATDASAYKEIPIGVAYPKNKKQIKQIVLFATKNNIPLIPRAAGTSLAGQVVGNGLIVDISKYLTDRIELNIEEKWIRVQPGVILDELNLYLKPHGLYFGPETSTSSRCMMGGMLGNNSCGARSLIYGSTRDHTLEVKAILSDGSEVTFKKLSKEKFINKCSLTTLEGKIYKQIFEILSSKKIQAEIEKQYPDKSIKRRNTGYALDLLIENEIFSENSSEQFNFSKLIAGSEGTLAFITEIKLNLVDIPPKEVALLCVHTKTLEESLHGNLVALRHSPTSVELMDNAILELTKKNIEQNKNRFFVKGNPGAILIIEIAKNSKEELEKSAQEIIADFKQSQIGYHFPIVYGNDISKVWNLRKAGLGVLSNMPGDAKPVAVIEDTAVNPKVLPEYIKELQVILNKYNLSCVYYAHIATGELHLRPILNLKDTKDTDLFHQIALESAKLVKKFKGSLSGEHGDGRLRGEFIPLMLGDKIYSLFKDIKQTWDPQNIFNPNKIIDTPKMNTFLRFSPNQKTPDIKTYFDFSNTEGYLRAIEKCNGSGDCRNTEIIGKTMCPSYQATKDESKTTRARANLLREFLNNHEKVKLFDHKELYDILDTCLSCKACKTECPSSVDMTKIKAEFLQQYYDIHSPSFRTKLIANYIKINSLMSIAPQLSNFFLKNKFTSKIIKKLTGFAQERSLPLISVKSLSKYYKSFIRNSKNEKVVYLYNDEFTNFNDSHIGIKCINLLDKLGYKVVIPDLKESGRTYLSKGFLKKAKILANFNVNHAKDYITSSTPLIGIEPSTILSFRDEYPNLVNDDLKNYANKLAKNCFTIEEFISSEFEKGNIKVESFSSAKKDIKVHGHCHQKALSSISITLKMLSIPQNYTAREIPSGCCGMAGSFGYEKEHYELSMKVGNLKLFPTIKALDNDIIVAAAGTSCREQIKDGTQREALHPVEILYEALL